MAIRINSYPAGELFLTQTHTSPIGVASGHLWYNSGTNFADSISAAPSEILPVYQEVQARPTLRLTPLALWHILTASSARTFTYRGLA